MMWIVSGNNCGFYVDEFGRHTYLEGVNLHSAMPIATNC